MDLAAHELPPGSARLEPYQNWLLHDAFYSPPRPEPHPVAAFVLANRGIGISLADLFRLFGSDETDSNRLSAVFEETQRQFQGQILPSDENQAPDGRVSRFPRSLCRFTEADGRRGVGWTEWLQPPPATDAARE